MDLIQSGLKLGIIGCCNTLYSVFFKFGLFSYTVEKEKHQQ